LRQKTPHQQISAKNPHNFMVYNEKRVRKACFFVYLLPYSIIFTIKGLEGSARVIVPKLVNTWLND
jgi:hypothetical protein